MKTSTIVYNDYLSIGHENDDDVAWVYFGDSYYEESEPGFQDEFHRGAQAYDETLVASGRISQDQGKGSICFRTDDKREQKKVIDHLISVTGGAIRFFVFLDNSDDGIGVQEFYSKYF